MEDRRDRPASRRSTGGWRRSSALSRQRPSSGSFDANLVARLIFITGTPPTVAEGSGTWVGISVLRDAIVALGHEVAILAPSPGAGESTLSRILFNLRVRKDLRTMRAGAVIGFDL